jgi:hypothetical protein
LQEPSQLIIAPCMSSARFTAKIATGEATNCAAKERRKDAYPFL